MAFSECLRNVAPKRSPITLTAALERFLPLSFCPPKPTPASNISARSALSVLWKIPRAFLILDGQHRVYGFRLAKTSVRVPVVIYNGLSRTEECRLFMDINTKQRPVPTELLLDIKRLAETETNQEALFRDVFDLFEREPDSPLLGLLSPSEKQTGKISRVTFNAALKAIWETFVGSDARHVYDVLSAYLHACISGLRGRDAAREHNESRAV